MAFQTNPHLKKIARLVGVQDARRAVQVLVRDKLSGGTSLEDLAHGLGVSEIVEETLSFEGGLFDVPGRGLLIKLNSASLPSRRRFTLAHEIGHLLLGTVPGLRSNCGGDAELERACDSIAAELLMPTDEATNFIKSLGRPSPEKLKTIAARYAVSLQAAAIRIHGDFGIWKCCVGFWERHPQIKTLWFVGRRRWDRPEPDSYSLDLALSSDTAVESQEIWQRGPIAERVWLNLKRDDKGRVLGLVDFVH